MTNVQIPEGTKLLAWIAITWLAMRSFSICTFVFLSFNMNVFRVAALHVQSGGAGTPLSGRCRDARPRSRGQGDEAATPVQNNNVTTHPRPSKTTPSRPPPHAAPHTPHSTPPPPPYSATPPRSAKQQATSTAIIELYEDIIASDAHTIQVQQQTLASHQDIIRSQAQMIVKLRYLLEEQDRRIEDLDEEARGLRVRRPGVDLAPRSRSS